MAEYRRAPEVEEVARELIREHHPHLAGERIEYLFIEKTPNSGGKELWGRARKITGLQALFANRGGLPMEYEDYPDAARGFFVIEVSEEIWENLTIAARRALVDHELTHCAVDEEKDKLTIRPHFLEEFSQVVHRHGLWRGDVEVFARVSAEQLELTAAGVGGGDGQD